MTFGEGVDRFLVPFLLQGLEFLDLLRGQDCLLHGLYNYERMTVAKGYINYFLMRFFAFFTENSM